MDNNPKIDKIELTPMVGVHNLAMPDFEHLPTAVWFTLLKIKLKNPRITDVEARYNQLIPRLPRQLLLAVQNLLPNPPETVKYEAVKEAVLKEAGPSYAVCLEELLRMIQLGDRKPSVLLREMQLSASSYKVTDSLVRDLWLHRLPEAIQALLAASPSKTLAELAAAADSVLERIPSLRQGIVSPVLSLQQSTSYVATPTLDRQVVDPRDLLINASRQELQHARI